MNGAAPKIEIFTPFGQAFELTKKILFQPFDLKKWCVIGFAAFLAMGSGGFSGFRFPGGGNWTNHVSTKGEDIRSFIGQLEPIWLIAIGVGIFLLIAIIVVFMWLRARAHFIFIDCVVRNRAAIVQPWHEYRAEGNNYFVFSLLVALGLVAFVAAFALLIIGGIMLSNRHQADASVLGIVLLVGTCLGLFFVLGLFGVLIQFVPPIMYRRRGGAWPALVDLLKLLGESPGIFILYFLFSIVIGIAMVVLLLVAVCATCCIAAIPYVGTVVLLPIYVFIQSFSLLFLRQFGPDYDVWQRLDQVSATSTLPPSVPPAPPPIQS